MASDISNHCHRQVRILGVAAGIVCLLLSSQAFAQDSTRVQLEGLADHVHTLDDSYHRLHDGQFMNVGGAEVMVGLDSVLSGLRTHVRWTGGFRAASLYENDVTLDWSQSLVMGGAGYGYRPWDFAEFYGNLSVGWSRQHLDVDADGVQFSQNFDTIALHPAVGAEFFLPLTPASEAPDNFSFGSDFTFGFNLEGGYFWQPPASFDNVTANTSGDFSGGGLDLGDLDVSGPTLSWGLFMRARFR